MNTFMNTLENKFNYKFTENGALAHRSTGSKVYDMFAFGGAYRNRSIEDCILLFKSAYEEDPDLALKCLFYLRDCRGGQGERRFFRICYKWLAENDPLAALKNLTYVSEFGRWDDLFVLLDTQLEVDICELVKSQLTLDMQDAVNHKAISLRGKWMPSENAHNKTTIANAKMIRKYLKMTSKQYRLMLSKLREHLKVLEKLMSANRWDEIQFDKIPSKAGLVYRNAFARRDIIAEKYETFAKDKNTKVNAKTLYPYEIVEKVINNTYRYGRDINFAGTETERAMLNKYWDNQIDYLNGESPSMLCVVDTSGSMYGRPMDVAISLSLYCAERMTGPFAGQYISFSSRPQLIKTEGIDFVDKVQRIYRTNLCDNTNLEAVFDLLLKTALNSKVRQEDIPRTIVVISDMEIDSGTWVRGTRCWSKNSAATEMEKIRMKWEHFGLKMPKLVYWNVCSRHDTILDSGSNVTFVSGCSPVIFEQVLTGKTGFDLMLDVLLKDRYKVICK